MPNILASSLSFLSQSMGKFLSQQSKYFLLKKNYVHFNSLGDLSIDTIDKSPNEWKYT